MSGPLWKQLGPLGRARKTQAASYATNVLAMAPYAYYKLVETSGTTVVDASGNGRNGTYVISPTLNAAAGPGASMGNCPLFTGVSTQYATVDACVAGLAASCTIAVWGKRTISMTSNYIFDTAAGRAIAGINGADTAACHFNGVWLSGVALDTGWHHWLVYFDGTTAHSYFDGALVNSAACTALSATQAAIGRRRSTNTAYWTGYIAHVVILDRAPTAGEITTLATAV